MKLLCLLLAVLLTGCTTTEISSGTWSMKRTSFLQGVGFKSIKAKANGELSMEGYVNNGGEDIAAAVTAAAVSAAMKSVAP